MANILDLQYCFLHFDVLEVLRSNNEHLQALLSAHPEHEDVLLEACCYLLVWIEQLEEQ